ncbi:hypothetical protein LIER_23437 [Lithospermum erythrorhizon]|uniref:Uncharacterized protein n=1 Tax=Lithospermum erythrorhizon TaxID=34254 RepID=A0AAV3QXP7_LITER
MSKMFKPCTDGIAVQLNAGSVATEVGSRREGGGESVVVRFEDVGRVDLSEEMESFDEFMRGVEICKKAVEFEKSLFGLKFCYGSYVISQLHFVKNIRKYEILAE